MWHRKQAGGPESTISESDAKKKKLTIPAPLKLQLPAQKGKPDLTVSFIQEEATEPPKKTEAPAKKTELKKPTIKEPAKNAI